jgi:sulfite reductase (NADPH) flavoprotein alpha-component
MTLHALSKAADLIPASAPFTEQQRAALNAFLTRALGLEAPGALQEQPRVGEPRDDGDEEAAPWHDPALSLEERMKLAQGRPLRRRMMAAMGQQDCGQCGYNCEDYANAIALHAEPRLNLCVPGGKATARMLKALVEEMGGGVIDPDEVAAKAAAALPFKTGDDRPGRSRDKPVEAIFLSRMRLNRPGSQKETYHVEIDLSQSELDYVPGDSFGIFPENDPALVDAILAAIGAPGDFPIAGRPLRNVLITDTSLSPAPDSLFQLISYLVGGERRRRAQALARGEDADGDAATLDVLAAVEKFPGIRPDPEAFMEVLEPLQPRLYSIASSPKANPGRVALTVDAVRYKVGTRLRLGVASTFLGERAHPGSRLKVYVQKAHSFSLPADPDLPIIMVGPGTGIAPFRAFLQERLATRARGKAWLFYGHQHRATDFFYEDELAAFQALGTLTKLSLAWSREGTEKVYVQHRMREEGADLFAWLEEGAHFYVCGDAKRMAGDVEAALLKIVAQHGCRSSDAAKEYVAALRSAGRYQADVY